MVSQLSIIRVHKRGVLLITILLLAALGARGVAEAQLTNSIREIQRYRDNPNRIKRLLQSKLEKLYTHKNELFTKHIIYAEKSGVELADATMQLYINEKMDAACDAADEVEILIADFENQAVTNQQAIDEQAQEQTKQNEITVAEAQSDSDELSLRHRVDTMMGIVNDADKNTRDDAALVMSHMSQVEESLQIQTKSWNALKSMELPADKMTTLFNKQHEAMKYVQDHLALATAYVNKIDPEVMNLKTRSSSSPSETGAQAQIKDDNKMLRMEKAKYPTFSGDIRNFARFRSDFNDFVVPSHKDPKSQVYVLKQTCLKGDVKKLIENMSDLTAIWERLESRYGDAIDIVSVVIKSVQDFTFGSSDYDKKIVQLVDTLESGVEDLNAIDGKQHIANAFTVKLLEEKLPRQILTRWLQCPGSSQTADNRFEEIFQFLKLERKQAERLILVSQSKQPEKPKKEDPLKRKGGGAAYVNATGGGQLNAMAGGGIQKSFNPKNRCLVHPESDHLTKNCRKFLSMNVETRGKFVKDNDGCRLCLSKSHGGNECPFAQSWSVCGIDNCQMLHSRLVHGCTISSIGCHAHITASIDGSGDSGETLLLIESVQTEIGTTVTFWDNGSTITLVAQSFAQRKNLRGVPVSYDLITVDGTVTVRHTTLYEITIIDREGGKYSVKALEIEEICGELKDIETDEFAQLFSNTTASDIKRPTGKIDMLIGSNYLSLHPSKLHSSEGLVLFSSYFGTGKVLGGTHRNIKERDIISSGARLCASAQITNIRISRDLIRKPGMDFITTEAFGVEGTTRCKKCASCQCSFECHQMSRQEQLELKQIRENMTLDPIEQVWTVSYPCKTDPSALKDNKHQAKSLAERTEKRLMKDPASAKMYNEQFQELLDRGVLVEITEEEDKQHQGPSFFASHHDVYKPGSTSTPIRLVINPSLKFNGLSPNDVWVKGPNSLNDMFGILLRFREHKYAVAGDMKKMYTMIHTTHKEKFLRKLLWRFMNVDQDFKTYGLDRVMFGDRPAAAVTAVAIRETAEVHKDVNPEAAEKIVKDTYVDDVTTGTDDKENVPILTRDITIIMKKGGIEMKGFVVSGDTSPEALALLGSGEIGRVLGVNWAPSPDVYTVTVRINISKKRRGARTEPDLAYHEIHRLLEIILTRRICQGIVYSCYDVYGLITPITIMMKIELRDLFSKELNLGWDDPVSDDAKRRWVEILQAVKMAEHVTFRRCVKPDGPVVGKPVLVMCNDGSSQAMCATAHIRWELENGEFECFLYASKTRVAPLQKLTIPRLEMQSAVLATRLSKSIIEHSNLEFDNVVHILDSTCTLATFQNDTAVFNDFTSNRKAEVLNSTQVKQWNHIESKKNIADLGTRTNARVDDVSEKSDWQRGTSWMRLPIEEWPVSQDVTGIAVPPETLLKKAIVASASSLNNVYDLRPFLGRSFTFLLRVTATVISILRNKSFRCPPEVTSEEIIDAEKACIKSSMHFTKPGFDAGKYRSLGAQLDEQGIVCVVSRAAAAMETHYGTDKFPILVYKDPLAYIWMQHVHAEDHTGITKTVSKSRRKFWIVRGRRLAEKVKRSCYTCRTIDKKLAEQQMAPLPTTRTKIAPTFHTTSMDLFGPILIRDTVKQRTRKKVWGVVFNCSVTRAVYLDLTEDYGTDAILQTLRRFTCIRGCPGEIQSDQGSQLIAAAEDISELVADWDWKPIHDWASTNKIKWTLAPAEGQHQNGLSESLVKLTKRSLKHIIAGNVLTFGQLQTVLFEAANIMNSRPIGILTGSDPTCPSPITPDDVILGRASSEVPQGPFDHEKSKSITKRFRFIQ